jgi:uncharacterized protein (TIGR03437 family)
MSGGSYLAAALNQDGTVNSPDNPAARGSVVSLFATGLGPFVPALFDNAWSPIAPPWTSLATPISAATVGSTLTPIRMPVLWAGPAPGESPGVYQINVQIPEDALAGTPPIVIGGNGVEYTPYLFLRGIYAWIAVKYAADDAAE